jgi:hypothetical protein
MVNVPFPPTDKLFCEVLDSVNELEFVPERAMFRLPVEVLPVLVMVTVLAPCEPYPAVAAGNVYVPVWLRETP